MEVINIYRPKDKNSLFIDQRGVIADVLYNTQVQHITYIESRPYVLRGNHYHKETTQVTLILEGRTNYWSQDIMFDISARMQILTSGDMVVAPPYHAHTFLSSEEGCKMMVFTNGIRGGVDYEKDTFKYLLYA